MGSGGGAIRMEMAALSWATASPANRSAGLSSTRPSGEYIGRRVGAGGGAGVGRFSGVGSFGGDFCDTSGSDSDTASSSTGAGVGCIRGGRSRNGSVTVSLRSSSRNSPVRAGMVFIGGGVSRSRFSPAASPPRSDGMYGSSGVGSGAVGANGPAATTCSGAGTVSGCRHFGQMLR